MINYSVDKEIVHVDFKGIIHLEELISFLKDFASIKGFPNPLRIVYDLQKTDIKIKSTDIEVISNYSEQATVNYTLVKTAIVVNEPMLTAYSMLFSNFADNEKTRRKIFSTKKAAIKWLLQNDYDI